MLALALAVPLAAAYLVLEPPSGDLAAATYRGDLFARAGFTLWDNNWYGGHYLPGYSLLAPALGALIRERLLLWRCARSPRPDSSACSRNRHSAAPPPAWLAARSR